MDASPPSEASQVQRRAIGRSEAGRVFPLAIIIFLVFLFFLHDFIVKFDFNHPISLFMSEHGRRRDFGPAINLLFASVLFWWMQPYIYGALSRNGEQLFVENGVLINGHPMFGAIPVKDVVCIYGARRGFWGPPALIVLRDQRTGWRFIALMTALYREPYEVLATRLLTHGVDVPEPDRQRDLALGTGTNNPSSLRQSPNGGAGRLTRLARTAPTATTGRTRGNADV